MAFPPFGCDPGAYTIRIRDTVVAILRGGGCSFGIKVINAQKVRNPKPQPYHYPNPTTNPTANPNPNPKSLER
jgi:hypothetical protein